MVHHHQINLAPSFAIPLPPPNKPRCPLARSGRASICFPRHATVTEPPRSCSGHRHLHQTPLSLNPAHVFTIFPRPFCAPYLARSGTGAAVGHRRPPHRRGVERPLGRARCPRSPTGEESSWAGLIQRDAAHFRYPARACRWAEPDRAVCPLRCRPVFK
jgi:hypothetical protein